MAIQHRRGSYNNFDPSRLLPGEWAIVTSDDDNVPDGKAVYICFASGDVKRLTTAEDMTAFTEYIEQVADEAEEAVEAVEQAIIGLIPTMSANIKGGAKLGNGLSVTDDVLSVDSSAIEIPPATTSRTGVVKPDGTSITVDSDGTIHGHAVGVTGVKGNSETSYRTGQVNLTPANIGAAASSHVHSAADITRGTLAVERGGTGKTSGQQARAYLGSIPMGTAGQKDITYTTVHFGVSLGGFEPFDGARIAVKFSSGTSDRERGVNLNVNSIGSLPVYYRGAASSSTNPVTWSGSSICEFVYDSSNDGCWHYLGNDVDGYYDYGAQQSIASVETDIGDTSLLSTGTVCGDVDALRDSVYLESGVEHVSFRVTANVLAVIFVTSSGRKFSIEFYFTAKNVSLFELFDDGTYRTIWSFT